MSVPYNYMPPPAGQSRGQVNAAIAAAADQYPDRIEPVPAVLCGITSTATFSGTATYSYRFRVAAPITVGRSEVYVGATPAGQLDCAVCTSPDAGVTLVRAAHSGLLTVSGANAAFVAPHDVALALVPGTDYWWTFRLTDSTLTLLRLVLTAGIAARGNKARSHSGLAGTDVPPSFAGGTSGTAAQPWFALTP